MSKGKWLRNDRGDGLHDQEREILELWDSGLSIQQVIRAVPYQPSTVRKIISMFGSPAVEHRRFKAEARASSDALVAAIAATGSRFA